MKETNNSKTEMTKIIVEAVDEYNANKHIGVDESVEKKADNFVKRPDGYTYLGKRYRELFIAGYTQRNDEVVKVIQSEIDILNERPEVYLYTIKTLKGLLTTLNKK